jgi:hypothetical protein
MATKRETEYVFVGSLETFPFTNANLIHPTFEARADADGIIRFVLVRYCHANVDPRLWLKRSSLAT